MLSDLRTGSVKGVAVKSEWIYDISNAAKTKFGDGIDSGAVIKKDGVSFNEHLVFMLVFIDIMNDHSVTIRIVTEWSFIILPIRFANLKAVDVGMVSYVWLRILPLAF
jgi:hypothetical protein